MNVDPQKKTIKELLISQKQFVIPRFQREFVWEKKQYVDFLEDILLSLEIEDNKVQSKQYFLGTMLFVGSFIDANCKCLHVVDGQQRLTTITIMFSAMAKTFEELKNKPLCDALFNYVMTKDDNNNPIRILKTETSYPFFSDYVQRLEKVETSIVSNEDENIKTAYDYFRNIFSEEQLKQKLKRIQTQYNFKDIDYIELLKSIRDTILNCMVICITTPEEKDSYKLFEILNGKGKTLSYVDLIKNRLFEELNSAEPSDFAKDRWATMLHNLRQGIDFIETDVFLRHYWMSTRGNVTKNKLYDKFLNLKKEDYESFLTDLVTNSKYYNLALNPRLDYFDNRKEYLPLVQALKWLNKFDIIQPRIAIIALLSLKEKGLIHCSKLTNAIRFILDFHFAYNALMKYRPNKLDKIYTRLANELRKIDSEASITSKLDSFLYKPLSLLMPNEIDFCSSFAELKYQKNGDETMNIKTTFAVNKINTIYSKKNYFENDGSIEHIVPEVIDASCASIGNLILLESVLNEEAKSLPYDTKRIIYKNSTYRWVLDFIAENSSFSLECFSKRAELMAKDFYESFIKPFKIPNNN